MKSTNNALPTANKTRHPFAISLDFIFDRTQFVGFDNFVKPIQPFILMQFQFIVSLHCNSECIDKINNNFFSSVYKIKKLG